jgi:hypothetical protein
VKRTTTLVLLLLWMSSAALAQYLIPWSSVNSGGRPGSGPGYSLNGSAGQAVQGTGTGTGYIGSWGFWYGWGTGGGPSPSESGWVRKADVPPGPKGKNVKDGGCLACDGGTDAGSVYAFKGNGRYEFYKYSMATNTWEAKESIPAIGRAGKKKAVKKGAALDALGGKVFGMKGNGTLEFWGYTSGTGWSQLADVPAGAKTVKEGSGLVAIWDDSDIVHFFLKGSGTTEFYRYSCSTNTWVVKANAPTGTSGKTFKNGSCLATDGTTIWALKGSYNELYAYDIATDIWTTKTPLPLIGSSGKKVKAKDGCGIAYSDGLVYCSKGGNSREFWSYRTDTNSWTQLEDMPLGGGKKVKGGGALCAGDGKLYGLKGNNTLEFYSYTPPTADREPLAAIRSDNVLSNSELGTRNSKLTVTPNPFSGTSTIRYSIPKGGSVSLKLYDMTGKGVGTLVSGYHAAGASSFIVSRSSLSSGIYVLRLETGNSTTTTKLIIE